MTRQHIVISVFDQQEGYLIGKGVLPLKAAIDNPDTEQSFVVRLSVFDESKGAVRLFYYFPYYSLY